MEITAHDYAIIAAAIRRYKLRPAVVIKHLRSRGVKHYKVYEALRAVDRGLIDSKSVSDAVILTLLSGIHERLMRCRQAALLFAGDKYSKEYLKGLLGGEYWKYYHAYAGMKFASLHSKTRKVNPALFQSLSVPVYGRAKTSLEAIITLLKSYTLKQIQQHLHRVRKNKRPNWRPSRAIYAAIKRLTTAGLTLEDMSLPYEEIKDKAVRFYFKRMLEIESGNIDAFLKDVYEKGTVKANLSEYKWVNAYKKFRYLFVGTFEIPGIKTFETFKALAFARAWSLLNYRKTGLSGQLHDMGEDLALSMRLSLPKIASEKEDIPNTEEGMLYMIRKIGRIGYKQALKTTNCTAKKDGTGFMRYMLESLIRSLGMTPNKFKIFLRTHDVNNIQSIEELRRIVPQRIKVEPQSVTDTWISTIKDLMRQRLNCVQIYKKIKAQGYSGSLVTLQRTVRKIRAAEATIYKLLRRVYERRSERDETGCFIA